LYPYPVLIVQVLTGNSAVGRITGFKIDLFIHKILTIWNS
jgi:hypothetical protein